MSTLRTNEIKTLADISLLKEGEAQKTVNTVSELLSVPTTVFNTVFVKDYHIDTEGGGGGVFVWDATAVKNTHNGGTIIDPDVTYPLDWTNQTQLQAWFDGSANVTTGCWVRKYDGAVNVKWFGAKGDGGTDDTIAIQSAIDWASVLHIPAGTYNILGSSVSGEAAISLHSDLEIYGDGVNTFIRQLGDTINGIAANKNNGGTSDVADNIKNIVIRDLSFTMEVATFREFQHSINLSAVSDVFITRCRFIGWRGDAIYIGSGAGVERHNERVSISDCYFDGVNKINRNAISIIDCEGAIIKNNYFTRCTRSDMPGAVDIEPNANTYHIARNITVANNHFFDIGGDSGVICFAIPGIAYTKMPRGFKIVDNYIDTFDVNRGVYFRYNTDGTGVTLDETFDSFDVLIKGNSIKNGRFSVVFGVTKGIKIEGNTFQDLEAGLSAYLNLTDPNFDVDIIGNEFLRCGQSTVDTTRNYGAQFANVKRLNVQGNNFVDCGRSTGGSGVSVAFRAGASSGVKIVGNTFASPAGRTSQAIANPLSLHTFLQSSNSEGLNLYLNSLTSSFLAGNLLTWTPEVTGSATAGTATYTTREAVYSVLNGVVSFKATIVWSGHTGVGQIYVSLPAPVNASEPTLSHVDVVTNNITLPAGAQSKALISRTGGRIQLYTSNAGSLSPMFSTVTPIPASGDLYLSGSYLME